MDKDGSFAYSPIKSIDFYNINAPFVIAPNPASSQATIFFKTQVAKAAINVYDVQGKLVLTQNAVNTNQAILKTDKLNSGTYMVNIIADGQVSNQQLVINK
jgi:myo-inositol-hexaphosphate 3-phosphohydrolase